MSKKDFLIATVMTILAMLALTACSSTDYSQAVPAATRTQFLRPPKEGNQYNA